MSVLIKGGRIITAADNYVGDIFVETHHSNIDYNLYEGTEVIGAPEVVLVRGQVVVENDEPGTGRFGEDLR